MVASAGALHVYSGFLPWSKDMQVKLTSDSKVPVWMHGCANLASGSLSFRMVRQWDVRVSI